MNALTEQLADDLDLELSGKVLPFAATDSEVEMDRIAGVYRRSISKYDQRISDTARNREATVASIEDRMRIERQRHDDAMAKMADEIAREKDRAARQIAADKKLMASCEMALSALVAE